MKQFYYSLLLLFTLPAARAQQYQQHVLLYALTEKDGLTDNRINCIVQDRKGIMWLGTDYGLNSFDGSVVRSYHAGPNSLPNNAIKDIKEDAEHTLWLATGNGLCSFNPANKAFTQYHYALQEESLNRYYSIALWNNYLLLATETGLEIFNKVTHQFVLVKNPSTNGAGNNNRIVKILVDSRQRIWLATFNGIWQYDFNSKLFSSYDNEANDALFDGLVNNLFEDRDGLLWFGTWNKGLKQLNPATKQVKTFMHYKGSSTTVLDMVRQQTGTGSTLWTNNYVSQVDTVAQAFVPMPATEDVKRVLANASHLYCDRDNLLWIATEEGLRIYNPAKQYFATTILAGLVPLTSQGISLWPLKNSFLMGAEGGTALQQFTNTVTLRNNLSAQITGGAAVMNIQKDNNQNYWLCTANGLFILDSNFHRKKMFLHNDKDNTSLPKNFLNNLLFKKDGEIWLMPWRKGIWRIDPQAGKFYRILINNKDTLLPYANISKAIEDEHGHIWITDYTGGLYKYTPSTGSVQNIIPHERLINACIAADQLWTVSSTTISSINLESAAVTSYPLPQGKNKWVYDFIAVDKRYLWIATKTGLLCFDITTQQFHQFTESDGLYSNLLDITFAQLGDGNLVMAGSTYTTVFSPTIVQQKSNASPLLFTKAMVNDIEKSMQGNTLHFAWNEKNITLNWALLNYSNAQGNTYYYRLEGVNNDWQYAGNKGTATFNSLAPGTYTFYYKAAMADGTSAPPASIQLIIAPPFWQTWWFRLLAIGMIAGIFYKVIRYIAQRNLKEKILRLEKEQAVEKERNRISQDMHDDLGSGLTKIAILTEVVKTQHQGNAYIDKISETARGLVDNLDEMVWALNPQNDSLDKLAGYIAAYAHQYMEGTHIDCQVLLPTTIPAFPIGEEKRRNIFMAVKEFLNNTVKHSGASQLTISLALTPAGFTLLLQDNGHGFDTAQPNNLGNGLYNMQQRINSIGGQARLTSSPSGTDLHITFS